MAHQQHHDVVGHTSADDEYLATPPGSGHEHTDASVWIIVKFGVWLVVAAIVIHIGIGFMFALLAEQREEEEHEFPLAVGQAPRLPAAPRLQAFPENEIYEFRLQEQAVLERYRWIDREAGRVQIPIDEAMRLTVERGLPVRPASPEALAEVPGAMPADSSAGRIVEAGRQ